MAPALKWQKILEEEASKNKVQVFYHSRGAQWGRAGLGRRTIYVPTPRSFASFFTGLHELGHIMSGHKAWDGKPEYVWEYEAYKWALNFCQNRGIPVPKRTIDNERNIIAEKAKEEADLGTRRLNANIVRFVKEGSDEDPDVAFVRKHITDEGRILNLKD